MTLNEISEGKTVRLLCIEGGKNVCTRVTQMGLTTNSRFSVLKNDNAGPVIVLQSGTKIIIGRGIASKISVEYA